MAVSPLSESTKRKYTSRNFLDGVKPSVEIIDLISDDEGPPLKRQKSTPPLIQHPLELADAASTSGSRAPRVDRSSTSTSRDHALQTASKGLPADPEGPPHPTSIPTKSPFSGTPDWAYKYGTPIHNRYYTHEEPTKLESKSPLVVSPRSRSLQDHVTSLPNRLSPDSVRSSSRRSSTGPTVEEEIAIIKSFFPRKGPGVQQQPAEQSDDTRESRELIEKSLANRGSSQKFAVHIPPVSFRTSQGAPVRRDLSYRFASVGRPPQVEVIIPSAQQIIESKRREERRQTLLRELEENSEPIKTELPEIEHYFGHNGFSATYSIDGDTKHMKKLAQAKVRKVERKKVILDLGNDLEVNDIAIQNDISFIHPHQQASEILDSKFEEVHHPPLTFTNDVNERKLGGKFQFIADYILRKGVSRVRPGSSTGCRCKGVCLPNECSCLLKDLDVTEDESGFSGKITTRVQTYKFSKEHGPLLQHAYIENYSRTSEITECNQLCGCGPDCWNRVVQKGRKIPLEIFQTPNDTGFGIRSSQRIVRGQFIDVYLGEVITQDELMARENAKDEKASSYIYSLDWWNDGASFYHQYHVDGENFGSPMRFVNHSCDPNSRSFTVQTGDHADKRVYYLAFFAIRDIEVDEEITIDYNPQLARDEQGRGLRVKKGETEESDEDNDEKDRENVIVDEDTVRCKCGAANCRVRLWPRASQRKRRSKRNVR